MFGKNKSTNFPIGYNVYHFEKHSSKKRIFNKRTCAFVGAAEEGLLTVSWAAFRNRSKAASVLLCNLSCEIK